MTMDAVETTLGTGIDSACVFGGGNGWGRRIVEALDGLSAETRIIEKDASHAQIVQALRQSTLVFIAIPDSAINPLLLEYGAALGGKILIDCATNKAGFGETLQQLAGSGVSVCSTHPMAASAGALRGQNVLIMPVGAGADRAESAASAIYRKLGMHCEPFTFDRHTEAMVILQMLPHLVQRLFIETLGYGLAGQDIGIGDLSRLASANYLLAELGLGRVAAQRADVSAGIIATGLQTPFGQDMLTRMRSGLERLQQAGGSRERLGELFEDGVRRLDPDGGWRTQMSDKTEAALIRLGNLRSRALTIDAPNRIGMLRDILTVLARHGIDMTALDSQLLAGDGGAGRVNFDIAISNEQIPYETLAQELAAIDARFIRFSEH
jgi:prephenate dehydrogenase